MLGGFYGNLHRAVIKKVADHNMMTTTSWQTVIKRIDAYERLIRLDKPIGWLLLLWPTLSALWLATAGRPQLNLVWTFVLGTILMRSAGCAVNDFADRKFDGQVQRTRDRPVATGEIKPWEALLVGAVLALLALLLVLPLNRMVLWLAFAALLIAITYPFTKRFFIMPQAYLGIAFSIGIPMAFAAAQNTLPPLVWVLLLANFFWVIAYDTEYAMVDREDDRKLGLKTSAITLGRYEVVTIMFCYALCLAIMIGVGIGQRLGIIYYSGLALAALIACYHYLLIRDRNPERCFKAFRHNHWFGLTIFVGVALDYALRVGAWPR